MNTITARSKNKKAVMDYQLLNQLALACHQGPVDEENRLWQTFLETSKDAFNAQYVTLLLRPPSDGDKGVVLNVFAPYLDTYHSYRGHYYSQDPLVDLPPGKALCLDEVVNMDEFRQTDYYQNFLYQVETEYILGVDFEDVSGFRGSLRLTRSRDDSNFNGDDKALLEAVIPHLVLSIEHYSRRVNLETHLAAYQAAFDQMALGCLVVKPDMQVQSKNQAASLFLNERRGLAIQPDGRLQVGTRAEHKAFSALIASMLGSLESYEAADESLEAAEIYEQNSVNAFRIQTIDSLVGVGLLCRVLPPSSTPDASPSVVIFISDPVRPKLSTTRLLEQLFGLTHSEARLCLLLANGATLDEAAQTLEVTRNTAKTHLSAAFAKTGVARQPALVQLILRSVASIG